ncbi:MAG: (d)CMP kinase [Chlamydiia bacterium]|nr:(d)CMP kinase [Chlamydiia bacterium]
MIIAIDGPSGTGKSTVAKGVAKKLGYTFFDTGAMYRSVAWMIRKEQIDPQDREKIKKQLPLFSYEIKSDAQGMRRYFACGTDVTEAIREPAISALASQIAAYEEVRALLVQIQRNFGTHRNAVFEGRDMGTVVFPKAELKIFLTARAEIRAQRRLNELFLKFPELASSLQFDQILQEITARDHTDSTRSISPLKQASDAVLIDTSDLSIEEVILKILTLANWKKQYPPMKIFYRIVYWITRTFFKLFFRLQIHGLEHFRPGAGIIASNHTSNYDPPVLSISCPEEVHFLAKESLFHVPLLGRLIRRLNSHPVSRSGSDASTFKQVIQLLQEGKKIILFPEGNRSPDGTLQPIERGLAFIAQKAVCPIFPAYIQGSFAAWPRVRRWPRLSGSIQVVFGTPIDSELCMGQSKKEKEEFMTTQTTSALKNLKAWLEEGAHGTPP